VQKNWLSRILKTSGKNQIPVESYEMEEVSEGVLPLQHGEASLQGLTGRSYLTRERLLKIEREAYEKGLKKGEELGRQLGEEKVKGVLVRVGNILNELETIKQKIYKESEKALLELSVEIAEKIINAELKVNREVVIGVVKNAISRVVGRENIRIRVNPMDMEILQQERGTLINWAGSKKMTLEGDHTIAPGGCLIDAEGNEVDARLDNQRKEIVRELRGPHIK